MKNQTLGDGVLSLILRPFSRRRQSPHTQTTLVSEAFTAL